VSYFARTLIRYSILGVHLMEPDDLRHIRPITVLRFARSSGALHDLWLHW